LLKLFFYKCRSTIEILHEGVESGLQCIGWGSVPAQPAALQAPRNAFSFAMGMTI
jgi:hypothetical protein